MKLLTKVPQLVIRVRPWTPGTDYQSHSAHNALPPSCTIDFFLCVSNGAKETLGEGGGRWSWEPEGGEHCRKTWKNRRAFGPWPPH